MPIFGETSITKLNVDDLEFTANTDNGAKKYLLDLIYPIGSIYIYQGEEKVDSCPIASTLGGTWERIRNEFLYATASIENLGKTGGNNNAWFVGHRHYTYDFGYNNSEKPNDYDQYIKLDLSHDHELDIVELPLWSTNDWMAWTTKWMEDTEADTGTMKTHKSQLKGEIKLNNKRLRGLSGADVDDTLRTDNSSIKKAGYVDLLTEDKEMMEANMPRYTSVLAWKRTE